MFPRALVAGIAAALLAGGAPAVQDGRPDERPFGSLERETAVRDWARNPPARQAEISAALADGRWAWQEAGLEALRRGLESGAWRGEAPQRGEAWAARALALALDGRGGAQAQALELLALWNQAPAPAPAELGEHAAAHVLPAVRLACVSFFTGRPDPEHAPILRALCDDSDPRVAQGAARVLLQLHGSSAAALELASRTCAFEPFVLLCEALARARPEAALLEALAARVEQDDAWEPAERRAGAAAVEALRVVAALPADPGILAAGWDDVAELAPQLRGLLLDAAAVARTRLPGLAARLLEHGAQALGDERRFAFEGALLAGEPPGVLARALELPECDAETLEALWQLVPFWSPEWPVAELAPWLAPRQPLALRLQALGALAAGAGREPTAEAGAVLAAHLSDGDATVAQLAFRALAGSTAPLPWMEALHAAFVALPVKDQALQLMHLPRRVPPELFSGDLLALAEAVPEVRATAFDVLTRQGADPRVEAALRRALEADVAALASAGPHPRALVLRAASLARSLHRVAGDEAVPALADAAERAGRAYEELGKVALAALGQSDAGRARLEPWLGEREQSRLRIEAELQWASRGHAGAALGLEADFARCDAELKVRTLRALAQSGLPSGRAFLRRVVVEGGAAAELRVLALEQLVALGGAEALLMEVADSSSVPELAGAALELLGRSGGAAEARWLAARLAASEAGSVSAGTPDSLAEFFREALLVALGHVRHLPPELSRAWLRLPLEAAAKDQQARFAGERLPAPDFRWRGELALASALAATGELQEHLDRAGPWWLLDGRLLAALAARAHEPRDPARREAQRLLLGAALIAFGGEAEAVERPARVFEAHERLLALAEAAGDWRAFELHAGRMLAAFTSRAVSQRELAASFGSFDPAAGSDPRARLESALWQARARAALARGERDAALAAAETAGRLTGFSHDAQRAQRRLREDLDAR